MLQRLDVTPSQAVLTEPADEVPLRVTAAFSDGQTRDVTGLSVFDPSNLVVRVDRDGVVHRQALGETTILVRYLDRQAVVQLAFIPDRPNFAWNDAPENNFIDHHVNAKLRTLRMLPSDLCSDAVFLRRAYLDTLGPPPTPEEARRFLDDAPHAYPSPPGESRREGHRPPHRRIAGPAGVRRLLGVEMVRSAARRGEGAGPQGRAAVPRLDSAEHRRGQAA